MPKLPLSIGKYKITGRLGKGGMSILYLAEHPSLGTTVVLKKLTLKGDSAHRERFRREASLMMKLRHENVVGVYDHFKEGGSHYLVMEYVDGRPLSELMAREGALPEDEARWLAGRVATALAHIHSRGIVHRDLKPSNILLGRDGTVKLGDFGIAFTPGGDDDITSEGTALGTPTFMAPEQLEDARGADERSDMWSFGVCFFEMLTGRKFITGPSPAAVRESLSDAVKSVRYRLPPDLHRRQRRLLAKTLKMKPEARLKDGQAAVRMLKASGDPIIPPVSLRERLDKLLAAMEGDSAAAARTPAVVENESVPELKTGGLPSLHSLFKSPSGGSGEIPVGRKHQKQNNPGHRFTAATVALILLGSALLVLAASFAVPGIWNSVFRRNTYGVFRLELVFPPEASEYWLTAATADIYREGDSSLHELTSPALGPADDGYSLGSRRVSLPAGAYRIRWSLGDRVSWYSFRLSSFSERRRSGAGILVLEETLEAPPAFPLNLSWSVEDALSGGDIRGEAVMSWERVDNPGGELLSGGIYSFHVDAPGYIPASFDIAVSPWRRNLNLHASLWPVPALLTIENDTGRLMMPRLDGEGKYLNMEDSPRFSRIGRLRSGASRVLYLLPGVYRLTPGLGRSTVETLSLKSGDTITAIIESDEGKQLSVIVQQSVDRP